MAARGRRHAPACVRVRRRDRAGVGHHGRRRGRAHDRDLSRQAHRQRAAPPIRTRWSPACRAAARRQPLSEFRAADLRGGAPARHSRRARRRPADASRTIRCCAMPTHVMFSAECLRATTGLDDLARGPAADGAAAPVRSSRSPTGPDAVRYVDRRRGAHHAGVQGRRGRYARRRRRVSRRHSRWRWPRAATRSRAMRFGAAAAALKCTRFGGSMGAPDARRGRGVSGEDSG